MTKIRNSLDLHLRILDILPRASVETDALGQLIIYTDLMEDDKGNLVPFFEPEYVEKDDVVLLKEGEIEHSPYCSCSQCNDSN